MSVLEIKFKSSLMKKVIDYRNIHSAFLRAKNNYMNRELQNFQDIQLFEKSVPNIYEYLYKILSGEIKYEFKPLEILNKPKKKIENEWKIRQIVRMNFFDSVVAQCFMNVLAEEIRYMLPISNLGYQLNNTFSDNMYQFWKYGYSKFVNYEIELSMNEKYNFVVEADIENFYPEIDTQRILTELKTVLCPNPEDESDYFNWINKILNLKGINEDGELIELKGLPQGPLFSPLLALFYIRGYLDSIKQKYSNTVPFGYVDDIRVYCETEEEGKAILSELSSFMENKGLKLNSTKSGIYAVNTEKLLETKIMGKASNLDRAIRDEVILSSNGKEEMRTRLKLLLKELGELYESENEKKEKLKERLGKFVDYRVIKLLDDDINLWEKNLEEFISVTSLQGNFIAMWHALFLSSTTFKQKKCFINALEKLLNVPEVTDFNYVNYIIFSYLFRWSPKELRYSSETIKEVVNKYFKNQNYLYIKALLTNIDNEWIPFLEGIDEELMNQDDELNNLLYSLKLTKIIKEEYKSNIYERSLQEKEGTLIHFIHTYNLSANYLESEQIKNIRYILFENNNGYWSTEIQNNCFTLKELSWRPDDAKNILINIFKWLKFQFDYTDSRIPTSVVNPKYISIDFINNVIYLFGNPSERNDIFYYETTNKLWKESLVELFETLFELNFEKGLISFLKSTNRSLLVWQYRILRKLSYKNFKLQEFVNFCLNVLENNSDYSISAEQFKIDHLVKHYITDFDQLDKLLLIGEFVENSWKNGAKETNFYTLHNHEHARYLIHQIHKIFEKSFFSIYLNSKEAFRLFSACYLHDIGMLSIPDIDRLREDKKQQLIFNVMRIIVNSKINLKLPHLIDINNEVEKIKEALVRDEHPLISEQELVGDYPSLPLTVAERRDIGIISSSHGKEKPEVNLVTDDLHDGRHPIRLKLCSLLLRVADLSDVSKERVRKEILERNYERMSEESIFHWVKHLSVDKLTIDTIRNEDPKAPIIIKLIIHHNFIPAGLIEKERLKAKCSNNCKLCLKDNGLEVGGQEGFFKEGIKTIKELDGTYKFFDASNCNLTCAFINKSYNWFFAEIIYINKYFKEKIINIEMDLSIKLNNKSVSDFHYVNNRNEKKSAQEFYHTYFQ